MFWSVQTVSVNAGVRQRRSVGQMDQDIWNRITPEGFQTVVPMTRDGLERHAPTVIVRFTMATRARR